LVGMLAGWLVDWFIIDSWMDGRMDGCVDWLIDWLITCMYVNVCSCINCVSHVSACVRKRARIYYMFTDEMCKCVYVCVCVCVCEHVYACARACVCVCLSVCLFVHVFVWARVFFQLHTDTPLTKRFVKVSLHHMFSYRPANNCCNCFVQHDTHKYMYYSPIVPEV
jgi:hypothetical protein